MGPIRHLLRLLVSTGVKTHVIRVAHLDVIIVLLSVAAIHPQIVPLPKYVVPTKNHVFAPPDSKKILAVDVNLRIHLRKPIRLR